MDPVTAQSRNIQRQTKDSYTECIHRAIRASIHYHAAHPEDIDTRLDEIAREWDVERLLEANASSLIILGSLLGLLGHRRGAVLTGAVSGFLLQHAVQGWCPPLVVFRRLGVRSKDEIVQEHYALRVLRGDLDHMLAGSYKQAQDRLPLVLALLDDEQPSEHGSAA